MKLKYHKYIVVVTICVICFIFQFKTLNEFPQYKHCWAQCDRYAIALGFLNNGGDFFHPETFIYNNQFPEGNFQTIRNTTITAVDFPIHDYIVSILMKIFNNTDPWCFRLYTLLYSIVGLFFLYKLSLLFTDSIVKSIGVVLFAISSPVLLYYQAGFLPTIPSLANTIIALFFLFKYYKTNIKKDYYIFILFLTLAILARLPFAIVLVAVICLEVLNVFRYKKIEYFKWLLFIFSVCFIGIYYQYNNYLRSEHGSLFLNVIMPVQSYNELTEFSIAVYDRWAYKYFSVINYILLLILCMLFLFNKIKKKNNLSELSKKLALLLMIVLFGCMLYYLLMTFQFLDHDYYFLDTFYLPIVCLFLFFVTVLPPIKNKKVSVVVGSVFLTLFIPTLYYANTVRDAEKADDFYKTQKTTAESFKNADQFLDSIKIPKDSKILVMGADGPNNPFILMKRKGFAMIYPDHEKIEMALKWPFDYVVLENSELINGIYPAYPNIQNELSKIAGNDNISVFTKNKNNRYNDFDTFFGLNIKEVKYKQRISFDTIPENCSGIDSLSSYCFSGIKSGFLRSETEFGFTHKIYNLSCLNSSSSMLKIQAYFSSKEKLSECLLCVSVKHKEKDIVFYANDLARLNISDSWNKQQFLFNLPIIDDKEFELTVFIWNRGKNKLFYDDFEVLIYQ